MKWTIERSKSKQPGMWHIQARTDDQLCSFAILATDKAPLTKTPGVGGTAFTAMSDQGHATMNVFGDLTFSGKWPKGFK